MARIPVGLQVYTVRNELAQDFVGTLRKVAEIGYEGVEVGPPPGMSARELRSLLDDLGLGTPGGHAGLNQLETDLPRVVETAHELGAKFVTVSSIPESRRSDAEGWRAAARAMNDVGAQLAQHGLTLCYHNHSFEFRKFDGEYGLDILYANSDPRYVQAQLDTYWVRHGGEDPAAYIRKYSGRAPLIHIKDMAPDGSFAEIGEGALDWPDIFAASEEGGAVWYLVEQDTCRRPPLESIRVSLENLRRMGKA
jgi:sugar phosphate isomerase/epimerase